MALSMVKLVDSKSKTCARIQVLHQGLPVLTRFFSSLKFRKTQEKGGKKNPRLPDDLVEEILHRLTMVKSLVRFKSVSKEWKSMIESGHLAEKHLRLRQKRYGAEEIKVIYEQTEEGWVMEFIQRYEQFDKAKKEKPEKVIRVAGSCNGLLCIYDLVRIYLTNPMTRVMRTLAPPQGTILSVGFGMDVVTGTYKVAIVYSFKEFGISDMIIFDMGTNEWRWRHLTDGPMPLDITIRPETNPVFVKGSLFWLMTTDQILVMDLHTEKFLTVSQPEDITNVSSPNPIYMLSFQDHLLLSDLSYVWVLMPGEVSEIRWKRTWFDPVIVPPVLPNSAWLSQTLVSPYQSSSPETESYSRLPS